MSTLDLISVLVCTAGLFGWISARILRMPSTIGTMLLTAGVSLVLLFSRAIAPGLHDWAFALVHQIDFASVVMRGMLPLLLFAGAFLLDLHSLAREKLLVGILSIAGTVLTFLAVAVLMHLALAAMHLQTGWLPCLFFGALMSPTDPIAVLELLGRVGVPRNIQAQLAGESLFNDGVGAVIFIALADAARGATPSPSAVALLLLIKVGGGLLLGTALAALFAYLVRVITAYELEIILSIGLAFGGYALADRLHLSAPLEAVAAGMAFRLFTRHYRTEISHGRLNAFWEVADHIQNSVLFVLLGLGVLAISFDRAAFAAGGAAIVSITAVRFAVVALLVSLVCRLFQRGHASSIQILTWGGLRGSLPIALALSIPPSANQPWILPATYITVVFSIVLQGGSMDLLLLRHRKPLPAD